ncbi:MAG: hypothetical protein ABII85_01840 [Bacillota bacterium]
MKTNEVEFNVKNVKYAVKTAGVYGAPVDLAYAESISLEPTYQSEPYYGDGDIIGEMTSDNGMTGTLAIIQKSDDYEIAMQRKMIIDGESVADITQKDSIEHAIYFEIDALVSGVSKTKKVWILNVTSGKPGETYTQSKGTPTVNNLEIPLTILGEKLMANDGVTVYKDVNGNEKKVIKITSKPGDTAYDTFGAAVPTPKMPLA